ncbi:hypothetical protein [Melghirimyces algeriensis]|uniref:Uncharacterized protein n=1 Tax=Melghirimyces algeriensis TaxID=910412 RepID=A0A521D9F3_9BACL|nr:hypothetical protein [Melghirimyces algeriensis]SMO68329.1 hypothetical protein SAMN06264849_105225 [Melghirimyces algeriensis]
MAITVGVYLGKKDRFLRNWYDILPRGQFPLLVKYCIQSYLKGVYFPLDTVCERDLFRSRLDSMQELSPTQRNVTFTEEDGPVFKWVDSVDNGYRSEEIKSILKDTILHTLLEEHERTPLARQRHRRHWNGYHGGRMYESGGRQPVYPWREEASHPEMMARENHASYSPPRDGEYVPKKVPERVSVEPGNPSVKKDTGKQEYVREEFAHWGHGLR